ncbi:DUF4166 domain-containing protein [Mesobacillus foraminis]|uniref:Uncharacterized protein DUF4166 n=1 Tax=Mesobacillus foraminis TaxID=279826 RepID=A0A4R2BEJ9_9BACI|nr:DUF4166 domain-containing protein [Mesobacillus foraminis]TCN25166.1 uncharacterized protein DUF4166 [Mesobacillus foraminis]
MSIYRELLGEDFQRLHPKLQQRYTFPEGKPFLGSGTMTRIENGGFWLKPFLAFATRWKFLFPEVGVDVPFTIKNTSRMLPSGETEIYWERTFYFKRRARHFNAFMTMDAERGVVKDYLGEPSLFYSDLKFEVTSDGRMRIRSGSQRVIIGKFESTVPRLLEGVVTVEEGYDDTREVYTIHVDIRNRLAGRLMSYQGEFTEQTL